MKIAAVVITPGLRGAVPGHMRAGLTCEPCWFGWRRFEACANRIDCLHAMTVDVVHAAIHRQVHVMEQIA